MRDKIVRDAKFNIFGLNLSEIFIIVSNLVPLFGALFLGWNLYSIVYIYWVEIVILGFYALIKIFVFEFSNAREKKISFSIGRVFKIFFIALIFVAIPLIAVLVILSSLSSVIYSIEESVRLIINGGLVKPNLMDFIFPISFLFLSHTFSFFYDFIGKKEFKNKKKITNLIISIYLRFIYLWGVVAAALILAPIIILLGVYLFKTESSLYVLALIITSLFIIVKIILDLRSHRKENKSYNSL